MNRRILNGMVRACQDFLEDKISTDYVLDFLIASANALEKLPREHSLMFHVLFDELAHVDGIPPSNEHIKRVIGDMLVFLDKLLKDDSGLH